MSFQNLEMQAVDDTNSDTAKALNNPSILDLIFSKLSLSDLKTSRLVCHVWRDVGETSLSKRTFLRVHKLFRYDGSRLSLITPIHDQLLRRLSLRYKYDGFDASIPTRKTTEVATRVFTDLRNISQFTREIDLLVTERKYANAFLSGLRKFKSSTNVQQISIRVDWISSSAGRGEYKVGKKLLPQNNLTSLRYEIHGNIPQEGSVGLHGFQPLLQTLMDAAPKLTSLEISSTFYPNLERCTNLKILKFRLVKTAAPTFVDLAAVIGMLTQVKDSLISLRLKYYGFSKLIVIHQDLNLPVMSKLVSLTIHPTPVYQFQDFLNQDHLPNLNHVSFCNDIQVWNWKWSTFLNLLKPHRGVTSLVLTLDCPWWEENPFAEKITQLFPSVKKFELTMILPITTHYITRLMEPFQIWGLEDVNVLAKYASVSSSLVDVLTNMSMWRGSKRVHFTDTFVTQANFTPCIQNIIQYSRGLESVKISGYGGVPEILEIIRPIFEASGAPIQLLGGVIRGA